MRVKALAAAAAAAAALKCPDIPVDDEPDAAVVGCDEGCALVVVAADDVEGGEAGFAAGAC